MNGAPEIMAENPRDLTRTTLGVLFIGGMMTACFYILGPFLTAIVWAATLVIATFPLLLRLQSALGGRRAIAVAVMTIGLLLVFVVPFWLAIATVVRNAGTLGGDESETIGQLRRRVRSAAPSLRAPFDALASALTLAVYADAVLEQQDWERARAAYSALAHQTEPHRAA